jgi:ribosomal 30S subunit maturation factor RimM
VNNKRKECMTYKKSVFSHTGNGDFYIGDLLGMETLRRKVHRLGSPSRIFQKRSRVQ